MNPLIIATATIVLHGDPSGIWSPSHSHMYPYPSPTSVIEAPEAVPDISIEVSPYVPDVRLTDERGNQLIK